jgi:hypothetical protein
MKKSSRNWERSTMTGWIYQCKTADGEICLDRIVSAPMKRVILTSIVLASIAAVPGRAFATATEVGSSRPFGLGVQLFEPTALVGKLFLDKNDAVDFGVGFWGYGRCYNNRNDWYYCDRGSQYFSVHADYIYQEPFVQAAPVRLDWHAGIGGRMVFHGYADENGTHDAALFARVPLGVDVTFRRPSWLEIYLEAAPGLWVIPPLAFDIDVGLGVRAYF